MISRLKTAWEDEYTNWNKASLCNKKYAYWWVDGVHFKVRDAENRCVLVVMGVNELGEKKFITI